eukprot:8650815-Alexandrium_andersonii.AAC.1
MAAAPRARARSKAQAAHAAAVLSSGPSPPLGLAGQACLVEAPTGPSPGSAAGRAWGASTR